VASMTEDKVKKVSFLEMIIGIAGIILIALGYYVSSKLFSGGFSSIYELFVVMVVILASVIIGTYLFYKGSVRFIFNIIRKKKNGYLNIIEVLSLSSIMFRMKSNAVLLTIITTVSALAIGLLSLSYISYYSAEKTAKNYVPADFSITDSQDATHFKEALNTNKIMYTEIIIDVIQATVNIEQVMDTGLDGLNYDPTAMILPIISEQAVAGINLSVDESLFSGLSSLTQNFLPLKSSGPIEIKGKHQVIAQKYMGISKVAPVSTYFTHGSFPVVIVDKTIFERLKNDLNPDIQKKSSIYIGINIKNTANIKEANEIFQRMSLNADSSNESQLEMIEYQKKNMGLIMFIVGFLGLTFLITSGCILYFKQMDESQDEKSNYTILRKLGFTQGDLLKGIQVKQIFNFGIPLVVGLLHSYFAVQSGWFLFGTALWTPMIMVMVLYTALYSIFGILSILHYKKVIKEAL